MDSQWNVPVDIPEDLNEVIRRGISSGKAAAARRSRLKRRAACTACSLALVAVLFAGGVRFSPAFADAVDDIPVIGELVQLFDKNAPLVQGGRRQESKAAALTMERHGSAEYISLKFQQADASLYQAEFASYPKTVTITLPGTKAVDILSEISRAKDTSQYIKSVCQLPSSTQETTVIQLELESDATVQIQEYRNPGSLMIRLTPAEIQMDTVYSVRTLSYDAQALQEILPQYAALSTRILRDDSGTFFVEFAQYDTQEEAQAACKTIPGSIIAEKRTGNNVPVCFSTMQDYESSCFLDQYDEVLRSAVTIDDILDFMDLHFAQATSEEQDIMLRGLSGMLQDCDEEIDWERIASFYRTAHQELPDYIRKNIDN